MRDLFNQRVDHFRYAGDEWLGLESGRWIAESPRRPLAIRRDDKDLMATGFSCVPEAATLKATTPSINEAAARFVSRPTILVISIRLL